MKGDLSTEKTDWAMAKGDLGKSTTKVDLGTMKVDLSEVKANMGKVKANMGKVKVDLNPTHSLFFSNLDLTYPLSHQGWSFKLCRSKPHSESSISPSLDTS